MLNLSEFELGWLVGIIEGEGCFSLSGGKYPVLTIVVKMTDKDTIEKVAKLLKVPTRNPILPKSPKHKIQYKVRLNSNLARAWMKILLPYMSERRKERIISLLNYYEETTGKRLKEVKQIRKLYKTGKYSQAEL